MGRQAAIFPSLRRIAKTFCQSFRRLLGCSCLAQFFLSFLCASFTKARFTGLNVGWVKSSSRPLLAWKRTVGAISLNLSTNFWYVVKQSNLVQEQHGLGLAPI